MLATYINARPNEIRNIQEKHIDLKQGFILIPYPKERIPKLIPLFQDDINIFKSFPKGLPDLYFFRHKDGRQFGRKYLYKCWKRPCKNLGVDNVYLYGGTRHSSAIALRKTRTPEEIKLATGHSTNKAFERYVNVDTDYLKAIYQDASGGKKLAKGFKQIEESN